VTDPELPPAEDENESDETLPEEKFGLSFWLVLALVGVLVLMVIFMNVPGIRGATGPEMAKINWSLASYANVTGVMVPALADPGVTARFDRDGILKGNAGCNGYSAPYTIYETALNISQPSSASLKCPSQAVMVQENQYLADLPRAASVRIGPDHLVLYDAAGKPLLEFRPA
jgi:heat shock protein HslJ